MIRIFQSDRPFSEFESVEIQHKLDHFTAEWSSHGNLLSAGGQLLHNRFVVLVVDESRFGASGCSIDKAMRFVQELGNAYGVDFFNRYLFSYVEGSSVKTVDRSTFAQLFATGKINDDTMVFDTLLTDADEFSTAFLKKLGNSWHRKMV